KSRKRRARRKAHTAASCADPRSAGKRLGEGTPALTICPAIAPRCKGHFGSYRRSIGDRERFLFTLRCCEGSTCCYGAGFPLSSPAPSTPYCYGNLRRNI